MTPIRVRGTSFPRALFLFLFYSLPGSYFDLDFFRTFLEKDWASRRWSKSRDKRPVWSGMITLAEAILPHLSLIVHSIMTQKESKVIVMIALGSLFFWRLKGESSPFWSPFFYFPGHFRASGSPSQALLARSGLGGQVGED